MATEMAAVTRVGTTMDQMAHHKAAAAPKVQAVREPPLLVELWLVLSLLLP